MLFVLLKMYVCVHVCVCIRINTYIFVFAFGQEVRGAPFSSARVIPVLCVTL